ncbi:MAG: non-ribosomal peptide synthetase [Armatimonadia bacterium]
MKTIGDILREQAAVRPEALAIAAPGQAPLSYAELLERAELLAGTLAMTGLQAGDRVAVVLPDGPELTVAILAVSAAFGCAPLNPRYRREEFLFYLSDVKARRVITAMGVGDAAREAADELGIEVSEVGDLLPDDQGGRYRMPLEAGSDDIAVLLHTSGTTDRPRLVPLRHRNLLAVAENKASSMALTPVDLCLCVMPLFHMHGIAVLLGSLFSGGGIACTAFSAPEFFGWVQELRPTWYTASPTVHQAILRQAARYPQVVAARPFRFIRSASAPMPTPVMAEMEQTWGVPVLDFYGLTEASTSAGHLPGAKHKPGSVGLPIGTAIATMSDQGEILPPGQIGEIVIRGENVMSGYEGNPEANASVFRDGWLRTGDEGYLDEEGYLFVCGRLKEMINRGGEKISPCEVDDALLRHPAVAEAVTFAIPDPILGEDVGAAVVPREGVQVDELSLRLAVAERLADFKVPRRIVFLDELPRSATGKLERIGLAERLGLGAADQKQKAAPTEYVAPRTETEAVLADIWAEVLGLELVGVNEDFLELGGDSLLAARVIARARVAFEQDLSVIEFFDRPTVAEQAELVQAGAVKV